MLSGDETNIFQSRYFCYLASKGSSKINHNSYYQWPIFCCSIFVCFLTSLKFNNLVLFLYCLWWFRPTFFYIFRWIFLSCQHSTRRHSISVSWQFEYVWINILNRFRNSRITILAWLTSSQLFLSVCHKFVAFAHKLHIPERIFGLVIVRSVTRLSFM